MSRPGRTVAHASWVLVALGACAALAVDRAKPKVVVFPLAGDADAATRERVAFSIRQKLDRDGTYAPLSGPEVGDLVAEPVDVTASVAAVERLAAGSGADVLVWGRLDGKLRQGGRGAAIKLRVFDLRQPDPLPHEVSADIIAPTDVRFVTERVAEAVADVRRHAHPSEQAVTRDPAAEALWSTNPNLVANGTFDKAGRWDGIYQAEKYPVPLSSALPAEDKIVIHRDPQAGNVLAMNLSRRAAENNGLACLSDPIRIDPAARYRLQFRYKSDGPRLHAFVKGYATGPDLTGKPTEREVYRRQVPPTGATDGEWVTVTDDLNPQHPTFKVEWLRVDLYAYLHAGTVQFDDVELRAVGAQTRRATDDALDKPATRPSTAPAPR